MALLTTWETEQIESIHLLLQQAAEVIEYFKENERRLSNKETVQDVDTEQLQFRLMMSNLYSVLDYTYYLLYCHFSNDGLPDFSSKSTQCGFPFKAKGVKISNTESHDQSQRFVDDKLMFLWGSKVNKGAYMWKEIGQILLTPQPKLKVDAKGDSLSVKPVIQSGEEESFSLLHYYRNCCTHRGLIRFEAKDIIFEIDQGTRALSVVKERNDREGVFSFDVPKTAYWIQLPGHVIDHRPANEQVPRMLIDVLQQLFTFTRRMCSRLLFAAILLPRASQILQNHVRVTFKGFDVKPIDGKQNVKVTVITREEELYEKDKDVDKTTAEERACVKLLSTLEKRQIFPDRPYAYFYSSLSEYKTDLPTLKFDTRQNCRQILNEYGQKLKNINFTLSVGKDPLEEVEDCSQHYRLCQWVEVCDVDGLCLFRVESGECVCKGKDPTKEEAAKKVVNELVRLGFIQYNII